MHTNAKEPAAGAGHMDVGYVAKLARLNLSEAEAALFQTQLDGILQYVESLRELNLDGIEPTAHATPRHNIFRDDLPTTGLDHDDVMKNAPAERGGQFVVPLIIE